MTLDLSKTYDNVDTYRLALKTVVEAKARKSPLMIDEKGLIYLPNPLRLTIEKTKGWLQVCKTINHTSPDWINQKLKEIVHYGEKWNDDFSVQKVRTAVADLLPPAAVPNPPALVLVLPPVPVLAPPPVLAQPPEEVQPPARPFMRPSAVKVIKYVGLFLGAGLLCQGVAMLAKSQPHKASITFPNPSTTSPQIDPTIYCEEDLLNQTGERKLKCQSKHRWKLDCNAALLNTPYPSLDKRSEKNHQLINIFKQCHEFDPELSWKAASKIVSYKGSAETELSLYEETWKNVFAKNSLNKRQATELFKTKKPENLFLKLIELRLKFEPAPYAELMGKALLTNTPPWASIVDDYLKIVDQYPEAHSHQEFIHTTKAILEACPTEFKSSLKRDLYVKAPHVYIEAMITTIRENLSASKTSLAYSHYVVLLDEINEQPEIRQIDKFNELTLHMLTVHKHYLPDLYLPDLFDKAFYKIEFGNKNIFATNEYQTICKDLFNHYLQIASDPYLVQPDTLFNLAENIYQERMLGHMYADHAAKALVDYKYSQSGIVAATFQYLKQINKVHGIGKTVVGVGAVFALHALYFRHLGLGGGPQVPAGNDDWIHPPAFSPAWNVPVAGLPPPAYNYLFPPGGAPLSQ